MTSCLRMVPKFSTPRSLAMWFNSLICIACSLAMLSDATILSRCGPRRSSRRGSSTLGSSASSTGVEGGWRAAEPEGSGAMAVSAAPLVNSGDSAGAASAGTEAAALALGFLVETLGINLNWLFWLDFKSQARALNALDGRQSEKFKMDWSTERPRQTSPQYGKGNFAVNSRTRCRIQTVLSKRFLDTDFTDFHGFIWHCLHSGKSV